MNPMTRIARLSAAFLASNLTRGAIAFVLSLIVGRALGVERFGRWVLCTTWASTLTIAVDFGFGLLLPRDGARADSRIGELCGTALVARLAAAVPAAIVLAVAASRVSVDAETIAGLRVAALLGVAGATYGCFGGAFRSQPRWVPTVLILETGWAAAQMAASWVVLFGSPARSGIVAVLTIATMAQIGQLLSVMVVWRTAFPGERVRVPSRTAVKHTCARALPFAASGIVANLQTRVAPLLLGYLSTQSELGAFAAAARFGTTARLAPGAIFAGALPVLSREHTDDPVAGSQAFASFHRAMVALAALTAVPCVVLGPLLLRAIYGTRFVGAAPALMVIGIGLLPALTNSAKKIFLYATGDERFVLQWSTVSLVIQVISGIVFMPRYGSVGAAAAIAIGEAVIWWPLADRARRTAPRSNPHHAPASTLAPVAPVVGDVPDPAAAR